MPTSIFVVGHWLIQAAFSTFEYINPFGNSAGAKLVDMPDGQAVGVFVITAEHHVVCVVMEPDQCFKILAAPLRGWEFSFRNGVCPTPFSSKTLMIGTDAASMYFLASSPSTPAHGRLRVYHIFCRSDLFITSGSPWSTPGKFIISLQVFYFRQIAAVFQHRLHQGQRQQFQIWLRGTQLGAPKLNLKGTCLPLLIMNWTLPCRTHWRSHGSLMVPTVPCTTANRANSRGWAWSFHMNMASPIKAGYDNDLRAPCYLLFQ